MEKYKVNVSDIEAALSSLGGSGKAKDIQDSVLKLFCKNVIPDNYRNEKSFRQTIQRKIEDYCPQAVGYDPSKKESKFIRIEHGFYRLATDHKQNEEPATEEVPDAQNYVEGATKQIFVNYYERNTQARKTCIQHHGTKCIACNFDFEAAYGEIGRGFIHVHHILPLKDVGGSYVVDPIRDLVPLCANCHAIVHRTTTPLSISDLQQLLRKMAQI